MATFKAKELTKLSAALRDFSVLFLVVLLFALFFQKVFSPSVTLSLGIPLWILQVVATIVLARRLRLRAAWFWGVLILFPVANWVVALALNQKAIRVFRGFGLSAGFRDRAVMRQLIENSPEEEREVNTGFTKLGIVVFLFFLTLALCFNAILVARLWRSMQTAAGLSAFVRLDYPTVIAKLSPRAEDGNSAVRARLGYALFFHSPPGSAERKRGVELLRQEADNDSVAALGYGQALMLGAEVPRDPALAFQYISQSAAAKNPAALGDLGAMYLKGWGTPANPEKAVELYRQAVDAGYSAALVDLGGCYENGYGTPRDPVRAVDCYRRGMAANVKNAKGAFALALRNGIGVESDSERALRLAHSAAKDNDALACHLLGVAYRDGDGVEENRAEAIQYLNRALAGGILAAKSDLAWVLLDEPGGKARAVELLREASADHDSAATNLLGVLYDKGETVEKNPEKALELYTEAANQGLPVAMYNLGITLLDLPGREAEGVAWLKKAAERESEDALNQLGLIYANGKYGQDADAKAAEAFYRQAFQLNVRVAAFNLYVLLNREQRQEEAIQMLELGANRNEPNAINMLGLLYDSGKGVTKDEGKALEYYLRAANLGFDVGMYNAGITLLDMGAEGTEGIAWLEKAAEKYNTAALNELAIIYEKGRYGQPQDIQKAEALYKEALELEHENTAFDYADFLFGQNRAEEGLKILQLGVKQGNPSCINKMGVLYAHGKHFPHDMEKALEHYRKAAAAGHEQATMNVARWLDDVGGREKEIIVWLEKAAALGVAEAFDWLGDRHEFGTGTPVNLNKAEEFYRKAADLDYLEAFCSLGRLYEKHAEFGKGKAEIEKLYRQAAEKEYAPGQYLLGVLLGEGSVEGRRWMEKAAKQGDTNALVHLGDLYYHGIGVIADLGKARDYFQKAAELDNVYAFNSLGYVCLKEKNLVEASKWFLRAAEQGDPDSMIHTATFFRDGDGNEPQDYDRAWEWVNKAHEAGNTDALYFLGQFYEQGIGVEQNNAKALEFYRKSKKAGDEDADKAIQALQKKMKKK